MRIQTAIATLLRLVCSLVLLCQLSTCRDSYGSIRPASAKAIRLWSVREIRHLKHDQLQGSVQVRVRGVVTYYDPVGPNLFVQDATDGIWLDLRDKKGDVPQPGQLLDVTGVAALGFSPYIARPQWKVLGNAPPPKPIHLSFDKASSGAYDSRWVEMDGVVRSFVEEADGNVLVIDVAVPMGNFKVRIPDYRAPFPTQLIDATVRFRGVCGAAFNRRNQLVAIHLLSPSIRDAQVLEPAAPDPFSVPAIGIGSISDYSADLTDVHRVKVVGTVTARFPERGLFVMDATGGVYVESQDGAQVQPGDEVEVIGFPAAGSYTPVLKSASFRATFKHREITPIAVTGQQALKGGYDAQLIRIQGTVQGQRQHLKSSALVVESSDHVTFEAVLPSLSETPWMPDVGTKVLLTGVCSIKADDNGNPLYFEVVLRSPADIHVTSYPPWLNGERAGLIAFLFGISTLAVAVWVAVLRKRVREQTEVIRRNLENEFALEERYRRMFERNVTGLYVADQNGRILDCNEACARILGFASRADLLNRSNEAEHIVGAFHQELLDGLSGESKETGNTERQFQKADKSVGWVLTSAKCVPQASGVALIEGALIDITERKAAEARIQFLAYFDSLTGLPNRTLLNDRLTKAIATARRHHEKVAVLFLDLDRFKNINDSLGHSYGDLLLKELSVRLQSWAREQDTVARLGGDEFVLVLTGITDADDAATAAERIVEVVTKEFTLRDKVLNATCSIGISLFPDHGHDVETLIKNADAAMYDSKEGGRNTFRFFTEEMNARVSERLALENSLHGAQQRQELFLMYQPEIDVLTGRITACEALLRWNNPELGMVPADKFVKIAENSGLIISIGEWVLRTACAHAKTWQKTSTVPVAVNVSAAQFRHAGFPEMVKQILEETELDPCCLELELTESLLLSDEDLIFHVLAELKKMGVKLAIDDFGTGYSSLSYLKQFSVSKLKIDRSFIHDLGHGSDDATIIAAIINMARCLKLKVAAEGVENQTQLTLLRQQGCDQVQGYFVSRPVSENGIKDMLLKLPTEVQQKLSASSASTPAASRSAASGSS